MNKKLVLFDIDSTLIDHTTIPSSIPCETEEAISRLKKNGHIVGLATGRGNLHSDFIMSQLDLDVAVTFGGHRVEAFDQVIYQKYLDQEEALHLLKAYRYSFAPSVAMDEKHIFLKDFFGLVKRQMNDNRRLIPGEPMITKITPFTRLDYKHRSYLSMMVFSKTIKDRHQYKNLDFNPWGDQGFEVYAKDISKYSGIVVLAEYLNIHLDDVIVFGDSYNDLVMLKNVKNSIAVGNGVDAAKKVASQVCPPINEGGILKACVAMELF